eukprot:CAMPEP_0170283842 /NCGR_PEP_ID=MMETSP0116_2-20130129/41956_1 /TAXON_ID=400756 /ORGANISM="Durinskia baltica, Strain CSIRO CS-38" /LENGTH=194 /DNA_ID=CAMNT_0010535215 /DNA_START=58 /DNA_END=639 /DNA_ORIENTATION=-
MPRPAWRRVAVLVPLAGAFALGSPAGDGADGGDDLVTLTLDLPPDVQRMFEEMCEMEGISQSEMLTRWIDSRWEAMGYTDEDLEDFDSAVCTEGDAHCMSDGGLRQADATPAARPTAASGAAVAGGARAPTEPRRADPLVAGPDRAFSAGSSGAFSPGRAGDAATPYGASSTADTGDRGSRRAMGQREVRSGGG